jgi:hypothetical protein
LENIQSLGTMKALNYVKNINYNETDDEENSKKLFEQIGSKQNIPYDYIREFKKVKREGFQTPVVFNPLTKKLINNDEYNLINFEVYDR